MPGPDIEGRHCNIGNRWAENGPSPSRLPVENAYKTEPHNALAGFCHADAAFQPVRRGAAASRAPDDPNVDSHSKTFRLLTTMTSHLPDHASGTRVFTHHDAFACTTVHSPAPAIYPPNK